MKRTLACAALLMMAMPTTAAAGNAPDPRLQSMLACRSIADGAARLQCYDQALPALSQAMQQGKLVSEIKDAPAAMGGVVKASGRQGENSFWIELENGDRWILLPKSDRRAPPAPGVMVRIRKTVLDSAYWISGPGWSESRARFVHKT